MAHGPLTQNSLHAPGREAARSRKQPDLPQTPLHVPGHQAARDENQSTGPLALSASRALARNLDMGWESFFSPGLNLGPVIVSRPS
jgi:hypothetical protein